MRDGKKDRGHLARKAAWLTIVTPLFVPHVICTVASKLDELIMHWAERLFVWAHPCLYTAHPPKREKTR